MPFDLGDHAARAIERRIMPEELSGFEECFISGTGAEVTPVSEAGPHTFRPGAMSRALIDDYSAEVRPKQKAAWDGN
jgi:branched-chain amino acid aminotransferase